MRKTVQATMNAMIFKFGLKDAYKRLDNFYKRRYLLGKLKLYEL